MQTDSEAFFESDLGIIEAQLRDLLRQRDVVADKMQRQILTLQIRELKAKLVQPRASLTAGPVQVLVSS